MSRDLLEYAKWYLEEDEYFISKYGKLIFRCPERKRYAIVLGFRFYISLPYKMLIKPYDTGKQIAIVPRDIIPIHNQDDW
jgi:hypothetical protein